jgi:hypothetical protein
MFLFIPLSARSLPSSNPTIPPAFIASFVLPFAILGLMMLVSFVLYVYGIIAAGLTLQGRPFRYVIIGRLVERYLQSGKVGATAA